MGCEVLVVPLTRGPNIFNGLSVLSPLLSLVDSTKVSVLTPTDRQEGQYGVHGAPNTGEFIEVVVNLKSCCGNENRLCLSRLHLRLYNLHHKFLKCRDVDKTAS